MKMYIKPNTEFVILNSLPLLVNQSGLAGVNMGGKKDDKIEADSRECHIWEDED